MPAIEYTDADGDVALLERDAYHADHDQLLTAYNEADGPGVDEKVTLPLHRVIKIVE